MTGTIPLAKSRTHDRRVVCKRCCSVMEDSEPCAPKGDFFHKKVFADGKANHCVNSGKVFREDDKEVEPFMRKSDRRAAKRAPRR